MAVPHYRAVMMWRCFVWFGQGSKYLVNGSQSCYATVSYPDFCPMLHALRSRNILNYTVARMYDDGDADPLQRIRDGRDVWSFPACFLQVNMTFLRLAGDQLTASPPPPSPKPQLGSVGAELIATAASRCRAPPKLPLYKQAQRSSPTSIESSLCDSNTKPIFINSAIP